MFSNPLLDSITPHTFQCEGIDFLEQNHYCILGDQMGLGKSLQALYRAIETGLPTLIVCPSYLRLNWYFEIDKLSRYFRNVRLIEKESELNTLSRKHDHIVIIGYNLVEKSSHLFDWARYVIFDEAHYLKDVRTRWTAAAHKHIYETEPDFVNLLSGTIIPNCVTEFYSPLRMCGYSKQNEKRKKSVYHDFEDPRDFFDHFAIRETTSYGTNWSGLQNVADLNLYKEHTYISRKQKDVLEDMPECVEQQIAVSYKDDPRLEAEWVKHNLNVDYKSKAKKMSAIRKAPFTAKFCKNLVEQNIPIAVYSDHRKSTEIIANELDVPFIVGGVSHKKRKDIERAFQAGEIPAFVSSIGAGSTGLNLTRAQALIKNDYSWKPSANEQADFRIRRMNSLHNTNIYNMVGSVQDERIIMRLNAKMKVIREVA